MKTKLEIEQIARALRVGLDREPIAYERNSDGDFIAPKKQIRPASPASPAQLWALLSKKSP